MGRVKPNSNAWETALSDEQRDQAFDLAKTLGYEKARHLIARELKIKAPSLAGMCRFYERMARIYNERSIEKALVDVGNLEDLDLTLPDGRPLVGFLDRYRLEPRGVEPVKVADGVEQSGEAGGVHRLRYSFDGTA